MIRRLIPEGEADPRTIGTPYDVGDVDPRTTGVYKTNENEDDLNSLPGIAYAIATGSLRQPVMRNQVTAQELVQALLERAVAEHGGVEAAVDHLSFVPEDNDLFGGARLEAVHGSLIGYNGFSGQQMIERYSSDQTLAQAFLMVAAFVLPGMAQSLLEAD